MLLCRTVQLITCRREERIWFQHFRLFWSALSSKLTHRTLKKYFSNVFDNVLESFRPFCSNSDSSAWANSNTYYGVTSLVVNENLDKVMLRHWRPEKKIKLMTMFGWHHKGDLNYRHIWKALSANQIMKNRIFHFYLFMLSLRSLLF